MGKRPGIVFDIESGPFNATNFNKSVDKMLANYGTLDTVIMSSKTFLSTWAPWPEYRGTPWADKYRLTMREHAAAKLHAMLFKLSILDKLSTEDWVNLKDKTVKRLKRAKWARY